MASARLIEIVLIAVLLRGCRASSPKSRLIGVAGISAGGSHTCAVLTDGTAWCWGEGFNGKLGNSSTEDSPTPVQVAELMNVADISAGKKHSCAALADGTARCWGWDHYGELGCGYRTLVTQTRPVQVIRLTGAVAISAGIYYGGAIRSDGTARCWGSNSSGNFGDGTNSDSSVPVEVSGPR